MTRTFARRGFTLIEMVVVVTLIGLLLTLAMPHYFSSIDRGKKTVQQQNLQTIRDGIDKFFADQGRYPDNLDELVTRRYLRTLPVDPVTEKSDWVIVPPPTDAIVGVPAAGTNASLAGVVNQGNVYDVRSNSQGTQP